MTDSEFSGFGAGEPMKYDLSGVTKSTMTLKGFYQAPKAYVIKPTVFGPSSGCWVGCCPRCGSLFVGASQSIVFGLTDAHMRTESHEVCQGCRDLKSWCACGVTL